MKILGTINCLTCLQGKEFLIDNDFLNFIFKNEDAFRSCFPFLAAGFPILDQLIVFEFVRDIFLEKEVHMRRKFLANTLFHPTVNQENMFQQIQESALLLSQIYSHKKQGVKSSMVDLFLAARIMILRSKNLYILTGNKSDFPICIFDTKDMFHWEDARNGTVFSFFILQFNKTKFENCLLNMANANTS